MLFLSHIFLLASLDTDHDFRVRFHGQHFWMMLGIQQGTFVLGCSENLYSCVVCNIVYLFDSFSGTILIILNYSNDRLRTFQMPFNPFLRLESFSILCRGFFSILRSVDLTEHISSFLPNPESTCVRF